MTRNFIVCCLFLISTALFSMENIDWSNYFAGNVGSTTKEEAASNARALLSQAIDASKLSAKTKGRGPRTVSSPVAALVDQTRCWAWLAYLLALQERRGDSLSSMVVLSRELSTNSQQIKLTDAKTKKLMHNFSDTMKLMVSLCVISPEISRVGLFALHTAHGSNEIWSYFLPEHVCAQFMWALKMLKAIGDTGRLEYLVENFVDGTQLVVSSHLKQNLEKIVCAINFPSTYNFYAKALQSHKLEMNLSNLQRMAKVEKYYRAANDAFAHIALGEMYMESYAGCGLDDVDRIRVASNFFKLAESDKDYAEHLAELYINHGKQLAMDAEFVFLKVSILFSGDKSERANQARAVAEVNLANSYVLEDKSTGGEFKEKTGKAALIFQKHPELFSANFGLATLYFNDRIGLDLTKAERRDRAINLLATSSPKNEMDKAERDNSLAIIYLADDANDNSSSMRWGEAEKLLESSAALLPRAKENLALFYLRDRCGLHLSTRERYFAAEKILLERPSEQLGMAYLLHFNLLGKTGGSRSEERILKHAREFIDDKTVPPSYRNYVSEALAFKTLQDRHDEVEAIAAQIHESELQLAEDFLAISTAMATESEEPSDATFFDDDPNPTSDGLSSAVDDESAQNAQQGKSPAAKSKKLDAVEKKLRRQKAAHLLRVQKLIADSIEAKKNNPVTLVPLRTIVFADAEIEAHYKEILADEKRGKKLPSLVDDILFYGHLVEGVGKPEKLKYERYNDCWSRRINSYDRIVYSVENDRIVIVECGEHYER